MDSFTHPPTENIYSLDTIYPMVYQMIKKERSDTSMGDSAIIAKPSDIPAILPAHKEALPPPKKKGVPWNKGRKGIYSEETRYKMGSGNRGKPSSRKIDFASREEIERLYWIDNLDLHGIGKLFNISPGTVYNRMVKLNIARRKRGFRKGHKPWTYGLTKDTDERLRKSGEKGSKTNKGSVPWNKGKKLHYDVWNKGKGDVMPEPWNKGLTKETDERVRKTAIEVSKANIGRVPWNKNKKFPQVAGESCHLWCGGCDNYRGEDWLYQRRKARQRDKGICYMCSADEKDHPRRFDIHHIEPYRISQDNTLENLMTLCLSCHKKIENITEDS